MELKPVIPELYVWGTLRIKILSYLKKRIEMDVYPNSWIVQGGGGIETLAAVPLTINEMLLQSYEGIIRVFPIGS